MRIVVAGGSGFLGSALVRTWRNDGHEVKVLTRRPRADDDVRWEPDTDGGTWTTALEHAGAVVNLAGEGIADTQWTAARKAAILGSRITSTRSLANAIRRCANPPRVFLSASAVGFYGIHEDEPLTEEAAAGTDFLATVCQEWERETTAAAGVARIVLLRTGLALARHGGALPRMALPFRWFVGGRLGSGRQFVPWIHLDDWVELVRWSLSNSAVSGPLNLVAPNPVTNAEFTRALSHAMGRPALLPVPAFALRTLLGAEMADALLLGGQRAVPAKAQQLGYRFRFTTAEAALQNVFGRP